MYQRRTLAISEDDRAELLYHRDHDPKPYVRERCSAVLKIADGHSPYAVANAPVVWTNVASLVPPSAVVRELGNAAWLL